MSNYKFSLVNSQIDGFQYIYSNIKLKKVGSTYKGCCPFHNEKTASFTVYPKGYVTKKGPQLTSTFYCFGCGAAGDVITFKQKQLNLISEENCTREEACDALINEFQLDINDENAEKEFLKEEKRRIEFSNCQLLSAGEINLICSCICRNYLSWIKENYFDFLENEILEIENTYNYIDSIIPESTLYQLQELVKDITNKINERKKMIIKEKNK